MKQFLKYVCATVVGLLITFCIFTVICFAVIAGVAATSDSTDIRDGSVLVVKLNGDIVEHVGGDDVNRMMGVTPSSQGVDDIVIAIDAAAKEPNIKGIYVESGLMLSDYSALVRPHRWKPPGSPSLGFSRQEHWSGLPFPSPMRESEK